MDTKLKKGKMVRAVIYRILAFAIFINMIVIVISNHDLFDDWTEIDYEYLLEGNPNALPEYREYIDTFYRNLMLKEAGIGDEEGYQLKNSEDIMAKIKQEFQWVKAYNYNDLLYGVYDTYTWRDEAIESNVSYPMLSSTGQPLLPDGVELCYFWNGSTEIEGEYYYYPQWTNYRPYQYGASRIMVVVAVDTDITDKIISPIDAFQAQAKQTQILFFAFLISFMLWILCLIASLLSMKAYKRAKESFAAVSGRVFLEIKLLVLILIGVAAFAATENWMRYMSYELLEGSTIYSLILMGLSIPLYLLWLDWKGNSLDVFKQCIPAVLYRELRDVMDGKPWEKKYFVFSTLPQILGIIAVVIAVIMSTFVPDWERIAQEIYLNTHFYYYVIFERVALQLMTPFYVAAAMLAIGVVLLIFAQIQKVRLYREVRNLTQAVSLIHKGNVSGVVGNKPYAYLEKAASELNELERGISSAVEVRSREERMKVELITNVSHDLKTPLTSLINYADLLCEEDLNEQAAGYALNMREKLYKLKNMVQDVFEISKASTGNLPLEIRTLELNKLILQTQADMDEKINESTLTLKNRLCEEPVYLNADADKLYRVFLNLYSNALKYSLEHSRVYTTVNATTEEIEVSIKNTSRYEMNFDETEIVERFVRADESRTSEGSGLGLSIVQSFVEAIDGSFDIFIDADMFTAVLRFPRVPAPKEESIQETAPTENFPAEIE